MRTITLKVPDEMHKELKLKVTMEDTTLQDYIMDLIRKDLKKEEA